MTDPVFHVDADLLGAGDRLTLEGSEGRHAADVRRLRTGELLVVTDGAGAAARCAVVGVRKGMLDLEVRDRWTEPEPYPRVVVVQALAKGDRGETAVETLTEVGVDVVVPWAAARSVVRWTPEREARALGRWRATAAEAAKQARRVRWPEVTAPTSTERVVELLSGADLGLVLHESAGTPLGSVELPGSRDSAIVIVVGPEGGIADAELAAFEGAGALLVRMGPSVMRTSTAGTAAAAAVLARTTRWS